MQISHARAVFSDWFVLTAAVFGVCLGTMAFACSGTDAQTETTIAAISEDELRQIVQRFETGETASRVNTVEHSVACLSQMAQGSEPDELRLSAAAR